MASTLIPTPQFPNVPNEPGVPGLLRAAGAVNTIASTFYAVSRYINLKPSNTWGIFYAGGKKALEPDSFLAIQFKKDKRVSDYPQEQGAFASYNKVAMPFDAIVRVSAGGSVSERHQFLEKIDALAGSLDLLSLITPEITYPSANIVRYDYERHLNSGAGYIIADIYFREIRVTAATNYTASSSRINPTEVQDPAAAAAYNQGAVQAAPVGVPPPAYLLRPVQ